MPPLTAGMRRVLAKSDGTTGDLPHWWMWVTSAFAMTGEPSYVQSLLDAADEGMTVIPTKESI